MDKLANMRSFIRVVDSGSFVRAAELLNIPKSSVTRHVQSLEEELGVKLLNRTSRSQNLTEQGEIYYQGALRLLEQLEVLDSNVQVSSMRPWGKIRVEMPNALAYCKIIPALPDFLARYPDIQVEVSVGNKSINLIEQNIDCVMRIGELQNESLIARSLGSLDMVTCAANSYLARYGTPQHPTELASAHSLVQIASPRTGQLIVHELYRDDQVEKMHGRWQFSANDSMAARSAALSGLGIVTTYRFLVEEFLQSGQMQALFPEWRNQQFPLHIAWPENRQLPSKVRIFIDWVRSLFALDG
ncbi:LysR family transcriptional regulator [Erwinia typographi]|uniref:LysR family transcriptional regulator n=1 Tax=Erwinia typographi TaxID=371042 RepID=A0A0A3YLY7_9GAMM|nr:LysR family transcriptional regulator [Erwinia typographi]KGT86489.1 LysR family transcriptional regulator [Erwinia typographi]